MVCYDFAKQDVSYDILIKSINSSSISQDVVSLIKRGDTLSVQFESDLSSDEQITLQTIVDAHVGGNGQFYQAIYQIDYYTSGIKIAEEWYETDNGDGTYTGKAKRTEYTWISNKLMQEDEYIYCTNGAIWVKNSYKYYTNGSSVIKKPV